ncbi:ABC transporter ATP-binding protein [Pseudooceanicola nanhaiensis]|uniref:ABC transporter ATP-binding protein n=1 Tax=Pseudooceanicola nanhaiensis TaxID=375761 RepID=UPI001CD7443A|nr:ABC transporter ATP-binding protein [Pseudooceanicola nanhaiensis]MCA0921877.1 ABC transporter ATP-binding protein [Pseudooceanicola nanhaiensis]
MTLLTLSDLSVTLRNRPVLDGITLSVSEGEFVGLIGPNGAGKTTLMRAALGLVPCAGHSSLAALSPAARAKQAAWMPQAREIAWPVSVETLVSLGRLPHGGGTEADAAAIEDALAQMQLSPLRARTATRLSGGEQARALIARALAQECPLLLADEPVAGLDPAHQIATMQVFARLAAEGRGVVTSLHDLGLAARHCTRLVLLAHGRILADGTPAEVLTPARMAEAFGVSIYHAETEDGPVFLPMGVLG